MKKQKKQHFTVVLLNGKIEEPRCFTRLELLDLWLAFGLAIKDGKEYLSPFKKRLKKV